MLFILLMWWPEFDGVKFRPPVCNPTLLCVVFLDVGQGDSIFIQSPTGGQMIIDGGRDNSVLREISDVMDFFDRDIDYILVTHPDSDHITGLVSVLDRYEVSGVIRTENVSQSAIWLSFEERIKSNKYNVFFAKRGQRYDLGGGVFLDIIFPDIDVSDFESNKSSIVARLTYGETSFLLTGDSPKGIEEYLVLIEGDSLQSDVLKVGHHGSRTSTSEMFLSEVSPSHAVVSAGKDNSYGHPHLEVTDLLFNYGVEILNTSDKGKIVFWSDGQSLELR